MTQEEIDEFGEMWLQNQKELREDEWKKYLLREEYEEIMNDIKKEE